MMTDVNGFQMYLDQRGGGEPLLLLHGGTGIGADWDLVFTGGDPTGFRVIVPEPCCGDVDEGPHRDNLRDVGRRYADVVSLKEVLAYIETLGRRND